MGSTLKYLIFTICVIIIVLVSSYAIVFKGADPFWALAAFILITEIKPTLDETD
jgi:hypothetical protein